MKLQVPLEPLVLWRDQPRPTPWADIFQREAPLDLEIGFGRGEFLMETSRACPERDIVAVELRYPSINKALRRLAHDPRPNVRLLLEDAEVVLTRLFEPRSLSRIFTLFPCPWPKKRHIKKRLYSTDFLRLAGSRLKDDGSIRIVTDHKPYMDWILEQLPGTGFEATWKLIPPSFGTKYESKWCDQGQREFYDLCLDKTDHHPVPVQEDLDLQIHSLETFNPDGFQPPPSSQEGTIHIKYNQFVYDARLELGMVRVTISEGTFTQGMWLEIRKRDHDWVIRPARGCSMVPTPGVQKALDFTLEAARTT